MCGIVGLLLKNKTLRPRLGEFITPMIACMSDRGPDSTGMAVFDAARPTTVRRYSLYARSPEPVWESLASSFAGAGGAATVEAVANRAVLETDAPPGEVTSWLADSFPGVALLSVGHGIDLYKDVGRPVDVAKKYDFMKLKGSHAIGHARMATESAVSPAHSHPFTAGEDFALVHNGSLSNPYSLRRMLEKKGVKFQTDNDTEAACRYLEWRMLEGDTLERAIKKAFVELDGFYTFLMATRGQMVLVRDPFACKPAVVAETDDYVAVASEFRSMAGLPGIGHATLFEPAPERIYAWKA